jgi:ABC-2 type transport system permease protein
MKRRHNKVNIYFQELRMSAKSLLYWTFGMLLMLMFFMLMFPTISQDAALMNQLISNFPPELTRALGLTALDLSNLMGFFSYSFLFILLIGSVYAMKAGMSVLSEEIRAKTADFLLSKPVSRNIIVTAKVTSVLSLLVIQTIIYITGAFMIVYLTTNHIFDKTTFLLINLSLLLVQLFFAALGLLLSVIAKKIKTVLPVALGIVFGFYVLQMLNQSLTDSNLAYITPFAYFDTSKIIATGAYDSTYLIIDIIIVLGFMALTYIIYNKKDMPSI